jgi:OmpA-OmpF porin, OOP family
MSTGRKVMINKQADYRMSGRTVGVRTLGLLLIVAMSVVVSGFDHRAMAVETFPTKDTPGISDLPGVKRFEGSFLLFREDVKYDEVNFPAGVISDKGSGVVAAKSLKKAGQRSALMYTVPALRSPLEVFRNYQTALKASGFTSVYECQDTACGDNTEYGISRGSSFWEPLFNSKGEPAFAGRGTPAVCVGGGEVVASLRYGLLDNPTTGETIAVMTWQPVVKGYALACPDEFENHTSALLLRVQTKAIEQKMVAVSASALNQSLTATGKVAIYGILFDTGKAIMKSESTSSLTEITKLLKGDASLRLHVVGHTDNQGGLEANFALSKARANAVRDYLVKTGGIVADRLTANGVASLAPVSTNSTDAGRAKNRRVELVII